MNRNFANGLMFGAGILLVIVVGIAVAVAADILTVDKDGTIRLRVSETGATSVNATDNTSPALTVTQNGSDSALEVTGGKVGIGTTDPVKPVVIATAVNDNVVNMVNTNATFFGSVLKASMTKAAASDCNLLVLSSDTDSQGVGGSTQFLVRGDGYTTLNSLRIVNSATPTGTADATGTTGDLAWDGNYLYIKTAAGWKRAALATW